LTPEDLTQVMPYAVSRAAVFAAPLTAAMSEFGIDTPQRQSAFLAQIAHESGSLKYVKEIADGSAYEGRKDLGNTSPGDGVRYKGRGLLQITGKANYLACGVGLSLDLIASPELLEQPENACRSAAWFWSSRGLNQFADKDHFGALTRRINGGFNGLDDRLAHWLRARRFFGL
jgi:putative chitinase